MEENILIVIVNSLKISEVGEMVRRVKTSRPSSCFFDFHDFYKMQLLCLYYLPVDPFLCLLFVCVIKIIVNFCIQIQFLHKGSSPNFASNIKRI